MIGRPFIFGAVLLAASGALPAQTELFVDASAETGLDFVHWNGMSGELYFVEMMGPGGALFDYDGDGDLDVYVVQGHMLGGKPASAALFPPPEPSPRDRLYRNDLVRGEDGRAVPRFVDVTETSGIRAPGYGMGVAAGDFDGDGDVDLYVLNFGANQLLRNDGDGTFTDATAGSGTGDERWSIGASVADFDGDGRLDLYVVNYVHFEVANNVVCYATSSRRDYCGPDAFEPVADALLRNVTAPGSGALRFEDVSIASGVGRVKGPGLGVVAADFDGDGRLDYYVANDGKPNTLWVQDRSGAAPVFRDDSLLAGVALNREGRPEASMGVDAGDFDGDGDEDLFMTHLAGETNTLYVNDGLGLFEDRTAAFGLGPASVAATSFGTGWMDVDNDGWLDLLVVNGAVKLLEPLARAGDRFPLDEPNQFFRNAGGRRFEDATAAAGPAFGEAAVSRGAAFGDVDNDGDVDALVLNNNAAAQLLVNRVGQDRSWIGVRATGAAAGGGRRDQLGSRVAVEVSGGAARWRRVRTDGSFSSSNDPRVLAGLGGGAAARLTVLWPDGRETRWLRPPAGRYLEVLRPGGASRTSGAIP